jgi:heme-degrading monooxygenase HmoA
VASLAIIRAIHLLPGREEEGVLWLEETEPLRRQAGQLGQYVLRGQVDPREFQWLQVWRDHQAYEGWRQSPDRARLSLERGHFMVHEPTRMYDVLA